MPGNIKSGVQSIFQDSLSPSFSFTIFASWAKLILPPTVSMLTLKGTGPSSFLSSFTSPASTFKSFTSMPE